MDPQLEPRSEKDSPTDGSAAGIGDMDVEATLGFWPTNAPDITNTAPRQYDMRTSSDYAPYGIEEVSVAISSARSASASFHLESSGFELIRQPTAMIDFFDSNEVTQTYYRECRDLAARLTGASQTFTYDHLVREPGKQTSGGGTDGATHVTGLEAGGGYVGAVHMDYTENTTWDDYLAVHGETPPEDPSRVIALNFWRPVSAVAEDNPLAVCDARTVRAQDLFENVVHGYGATNYSWHDIGIETYNVKSSSEQRWYYYPRMTTDEVLVFKSFDSMGVIGRTCPHGSFANPLASPEAASRISIELRVLCFVA